MVLVILQYISIIIEIIIAVFGFLISYQKNKNYGYGIALTFGIYVFYDLVKLTSLPINENILYVLFLIATLSMLWSVWLIYKAKK